MTGAREPRLADYVTAVPVHNAPGQVIMRCRIEEGGKPCTWTAQALHSHIGAELGYGHVYAEHGIRLRRQPETPGRAAALVRKPRIA